MIKKYLKTVFLDKKHFLQTFVQEKEHKELKFRRTKVFGPKNKRIIEKGKREKIRRKNIRPKDQISCENVFLPSPTFPS